MSIVREQSGDIRRFMSDRVGGFRGGEPSGIEQHVRTERGGSVTVRGGVDGPVTFTLENDRGVVSVQEYPREQYERQGGQILGQLSAKEEFLPVDLEGDPRERALELLEHGADSSYQVDEWTRFLARDQAESGGVYGEALQAANHSRQWPPFLRELFARLLGEPPPLATPALPWVDKALDKLRADPRWDKLKARADGDEWSAGVAAGHLGRALAKELTLSKDDPAELEASIQEAEKLGIDPSKVVPPSRLDAAQRLSALTLQQAEQMDLEDVEEEHTAAALDDALVALQDDSLALAGLGVGSGSGNLSGVDLPREQLRQAIAKDPGLRRVAELAGRMRLSMRRAQRERVSYLAEELVDTTIGGEVQRLVPAELAKLVDLELETDLLRRLSEQQAQQYRLEGFEARERGPIIMAVDSSASMQGERHEWAMACALALAEMCMIQKRPFVLLHFDTQVQHVLEVPRTGKIAFAEFKRALAYFSNGGTAFAPVFRWVFDWKARRGLLQEADLVMITDGGAYGWEKALEILQETETKVYAVGIGALPAALKAKIDGHSEITNLEEAPEVLWQVGS